MARKFDAEIFPVQPDIGDHQMHLLPVEMVERLLKIIESCDYLISEVHEHGFGVKRRQRLILYDKDPLDDPFALTEQHHVPEHQPQL
jgi:hypothetical protein